MKNKIQFRFMAALIFGAALFTSPVQAQLVLTGSNYTQNFNTIGSGLPPGWSVRTGATTNSLGVPATFNTSAVSWGTQTGQFGNAAGTTNNSLTAATGTESSAQQGEFTNRCPSIRQTGAFGDPGAAFVFQIANTTGFSNLTFTVDLCMLKVNANSNAWTVDYAVGNSPSAFILLGTNSDPGVFGSTNRSFNLGSDADNQPANVWIRIAALTPSANTSSRDTFGIDNFVLNYAGSLAPALSSPPVNCTHAVLTTASFAVAASGAPPLAYQWFKDNSPLANGAKISGATSDALTLGSLLHADAGNYQVVVTNLFGAVTSAPVTLTVVGFAILPLPPTNVLAGTPVTVPVNFADNQIPVATVSGSSSNQAILPDLNISGASTGNAGTATLTPLAGAGGVVLASLIASDGSFAATGIFPLLVVPSTNVLFNDHFDYPDGPVTAGSLGLWRNHSGPAGELTITNGALRVSRSCTEDANVALLGQPYETNRPAALYSRFNVRFTDLPSSVGNYFAHFNANAGQHARIWASTANTHTGGTFRLGVGNASATTNTQFPLDLNLNTNYTVVTRLVLTNGVSTLWINPASETDPGVTAGDPVTNLAAVTAYAFRQENSEGNILVDDLVVATTFDDALGAVPSIPLSIQTAGPGIVLTWNNAAFALQSSTNAAGPYSDVIGATSPHTNHPASPAMFYRLRF